MSLGAYQSEVGRGNLLNALTHPSVVNPAGAMASAAQTANALYSLRTNQADQAVGGILQQATDPQGNVDYGKANLLAAQAGPVVQMGMQNMLANNAARRGQQIAQAGAMNSAVGGAITAALQAPNEQLESSVVQQAQRLIDLGLPRDGILTSLLRMPSDPAQLRQQLETYRTSLLPSGEATQQIYGAPGTATGPGGVAIGTMQNPRTGTLTAPPGQGVQLGLGPEGQAQYQQWLQAEVEIPDPTNPGGTQKATRLQMFQKMGVDPKLFYPGSPGSSATAPAPAPSPAPNASTTATIPPASSSAGTPLAKPSQADIETQKAGAGMGIALTQRAGQVPDNQANLGTLLTDASKLDSMGAGSAREAYLNSFFQKWSGSGLLGNATQQQIAAAESFNKVANIMAGSQMAALGASDARQQLAIGANPHLDLSKLGNEQIIHMLQGNEDAIAAKSRAWEDWKLTHGSGSYAQFQNDLNKNFDLRAFQQRYMGPSEIDAMRKQMQSQGTDKDFIRKVLYARQQGWIQ